MKKKEFTFKSKVWLHSTDKASWHFLSLPVTLAEDINNLYSDYKRGWGSLPIEVSVGLSTWKTSIFPDKKNDTYILPIKASIRKAENITVDNEIKIKIRILI